MEALLGDALRLLSRLPLLYIAAGLCVPYLLYELWLALRGRGLGS